MLSNLQEILDLYGIIVTNIMDMSIKLVYVPNSYKNCSIKFMLFN